MTKQPHPLTDKMIQAISHNIHAYDDTRPFRADMRAAYDRAIDCFSDWIRKNGHEYVYESHYEIGVQTDFERMIADFNQAMRPRLQEDNFS
jgi:hypothetical protein